MACGQVPAARVLPRACCRRGHEPRLRVDGYASGGATVLHGHAPITRRLPELAGSAGLRNARASQSATGAHVQGLERSCGRAKARHVALERFESRNVIDIEIARGRLGFPERYRVDRALVPVDLIAAACTVTYGVAGAELVERLWATVRPPRPDAEHARPPATRRPITGTGSRPRHGGYPRHVMTLRVGSS